MLIEDFKSFQTRSLEKSADMPAEMISAASERQESYKNLKAELDTELMEVLQKLEQLQHKVHVNIRTE